MLAFIILLMVLPKLVALDATFCVPAWAVYSGPLDSGMCPVPPQVSETHGWLDFGQWQKSLFCLVSASWHSTDVERAGEGNSMTMTMTSYMTGLNYVCQSDFLYYNESSDKNQPKKGKASFGS